MKKIFTLIAMAVIAMSANAQKITFGEADVAEQGTLNGKTYGEGFVVKVVDEVNKMALDANNVYFGTAESYEKLTHRLKSGAKSQTAEGKHCQLDLTIPEAGTLKVGVRTGSNSATDRNLVITQGETELYNKVVQEGDATKVTISDKETNVYPYVEVAVEAGTVVLTFPTGSLNFYAFEFVAGGGDEPGQGGGGEGTGETDTYVAITADGLAAEFAAVVDESGLATNVVDHNSIVKIEKNNISLEAVASAVPNEVTADAISTWNDVKWNKQNQGDIDFYFIEGTGVAYTSWAYEEIVTDGEKTGRYRLLIGTDDNGWPNFYVTDGSHGLPISGLYYKYTPKVNGKLKMGVRMIKGNRRLFVVDGETKQAIDYTAEGYINGQNETYTKDDGTEASRKKYLTNEEIRALGTDPYVMGAGNQPFWGWITFDVEAGKDYYVFSQNAQVGFQGFEFTAAGGETGVREIVNVKADENAPAYNLAGQRVSRNAKGIVIINGKKYINR